MPPFGNRLDFILFPACAGVIQRLLGVGDRIGAFPRMRGGDPVAISDDVLNGVFSPHARG